jgi:hypothetical protein
MARPTPGRFPFDDDDRPSGSVRPLSQADLQAILAHLSDDDDALLAGTGADRPVVAVRVRPTVGRPGGSAQARWRRLRAAEWAAWTQTLPWRIAAILGVGAGGGILGSLLAPRLSLLLSGLAAIVAGWGLRFRPSQEASAWRHGAAGERSTARLLAPLERHGWAVLHDLAVPGSRANLDHLVIGPGGVFAIDSKQYRGRLQLDAVGKLWHGRYPLTLVLRAASWEAARPPRLCPTRAWRWCQSWPSTAPRSPGARWSPAACRWCRPGACQASFATSRRCWAPSGSPGWPTRPGSASTPPPNLQPPQDPQLVRQKSFPFPFPPCRMRTWRRPRRPAAGQSLSREGMRPPYVALHWQALSARRYRPMSLWPAPFAWHPDADV